MIRALIFDFDGLILETETPVFNSWKELYNQYGLELTLEKWSSVIGTQASEFDPAGEIDRLYPGKIDWSVVGPQRLRRENDLVAEQTTLPGVIEILDSARRLGLSTAIASSSTHEWVDYHLDRIGLSKYFDLVRCYDDTNVSKPEPDLYLSAMKGLGVESHMAFALEDSPIGSLAARRAGLFCVVVPNALTSQLPFQAGDLFIDTLAGVSLEHLLTLVADGMGKNGRIVV